MDEGKEDNSEGHLVRVCENGLDEVRAEPIGGWAPGDPADGPNAAPVEGGDVSTGVEVVKHRQGRQESASRPWAGRGGQGEEVGIDSGGQR